MSTPEPTDALPPSTQQLAEAVIQNWIELMEAHDPFTEVAKKAEKTEPKKLELPEGLRDGSQPKLALVMTFALELVDWVAPMAKEEIKTRAFEQLREVYGTDGFELMDRLEWARIWAGRRSPLSQVFIRSPVCKLHVAHHRYLRSLSELGLQLIAEKK